jgi:hypothetical protein
LLTKKFKKSVKKKIVMVLVWTTPLYEFETWTIKKEDIQ